METFYEDADGVLERAEEAKQEAGRACALDEARSYYDAIQHYDQAITVIDGILSTVSSNAAVWEKLVVYRQSYSDRMEELREHLRNEVITRSSNRKNRRLSRVVFDEKADPALTQAAPLEAPPQDRRCVSYWLMRVIRTTILSGGFISSDVYVPKVVWTQVGAKFHALGAKVSALEHLMILLTTQVFPLEYPDDMHTTEEITNLFSSFYRELITLQNSLSKPFTYIKEMPVPGMAPAPSPTTQVGRLTSMFSNVGKNVIKYAEVGYSRLGSVMKARVTDVEMAGYVALASELCEKCQILDGWRVFVEKEIKLLAVQADKPASPLKTPVAKLDLTSLVAHNIDSKGVNSSPRRRSGSREEVASSPRRDLQRAASESLVSAGSASPSTLTPRMSPRVPSPQISPRDSPRRRMSVNMYEVEKARVSDLSPECDDGTYRAELSIGGEPHLHAAKHIARLEELLVVLTNISEFMRNVFCEILLQDMEYLLCRYLKKTRKGLAHMYWDEDDSRSGRRGILERADSSMSVDD